jgi:hypothetical protein
MSPFRMRLSLFSLLLLCSCASQYKGLTVARIDASCIERIRPKHLTASWYDASIDVVGKHISGLLLIKQMDDRSYRVVFTNEAGVKFLDFEFSADNKFKAYHILPQLNKKAVVALLRSDFELILGLPFEAETFKSWVKDGEIYYGVEANRLNHYYITDSDCTTLKRVESGSKKKRLTSLQLYGTDTAQPDSLKLKHHTFAMNMDLRKLKRD